MKKLIFICLNMLIYLNLCADIDKDITYAIKKSKPDLLKKYLKDISLTEEQKKKYLQLASEVSYIRETKMNINFIKPKRPTLCDDHFKALCLTLFALVLTGSTLEVCQKNNNVLPIFFVGALDIYFYKKIKEWWLKGIEFNKEAMKNYRTPKQKYLDSIEIKQLF